MTTQEKLETIRTKCIEANPNIITVRRKKQLRHIGEVCDDDPTYYFRKVEQARPIHLADVLLALNGDGTPRNEGVAVNSGGQMALLYLDEYGITSRKSAVYTWNLREDDLTKQSPETIDFLYSILISAPVEAEPTDQAA